MKKPKPRLVIVHEVDAVEWVCPKGHKERLAMRRGRPLCPVCLKRALRKLGVPLMEKAK